jgi:hypothetical protein
MTKGEQLVRVDFNVANLDSVTDVKVKTAELINFVEANKELDGRLAALAITAYEEAAMWSVKLLTTKK